MRDQVIEFLKMDSKGAVTPVRTLKQSSLLQCPWHIMVAAHYREDETCKCDDLTERKRMVKEWDYKMRDFANIPLRKGKA